MEVNLTGFKCGRRHIYGSEVVKTSDQREVSCMTIIFKELPEKEMNVNFAGRNSLLMKTGKR